MAFALLSHFHVDDYDAWKEMFDSDPLDRVQAAKGHTIYRKVDDSNDVYIATEFDSADAADAFREKLLASGVLDNVEVVSAPTIAEVADSATY